MNLNDSNKEKFLKLEFHDTGGAGGFTVLQQDRFLRKDANQADRTKDSIYAVSNPAPKRGDDALRKIGRPKGSEEDGGAPNVLTGTVIVSCVIQTSALPYRIELEGNDLTFFDDTYAENLQVVGDTSRLIFTHASGKKGEVVTQGFIFEKRASGFNTYDNVLSIYALPNKPGASNQIWFGRDASQGSPVSYMNAIHFAVNADTDLVPRLDNTPFNGVFEAEYWENEEFQGRVLYSGRSESLLPGLGFQGYSSFLFAGQGGLSGLGYKDGNDIFILFYAYAKDGLGMGATILADLDNTYDIGGPSNRIRDIYVGGSIIGATIELPGGITWTSGVGSPEGVVTAPIGSLYSNTSGGASTTLYVKTSGAGNTGWTAK